MHTLMTVQDVWYVETRMMDYCTRCFVDKEVIAMQSWS